jgi:hypothetical protein
MQFIETITETTSINSMLYNLDKNWDQMSFEVGSIFFDEDSDISKLKCNSLAKLVGLLPTIAGCKDAYRNGFTNLCTLIIASNPKAKDVFKHRKSDDIAVNRRLLPISNFFGGDSQILSSGMAYIGIILLNDYKRDMKEDHQSRKYNPITEGVWDVECEIDKLITIINSSRNALIDSIIPYPTFRTS